MIGSTLVKKNEKVNAWRRRYQKETRTGLYVFSKPQRLLIKYELIRLLLFFAFNSKGFQRLLILTKYYDFACKFVNQKAKACPLEKPLSNECSFRFVVGISWDEIHRQQAINDGWCCYLVETPLINPPLLDKQMMLNEAKSDGLQPPRLYSYGLAHSNCGGGCVRAGIAHWKHIYRVLPKVFKLWKEEEQKMREKLNKNVSILAKNSKPYTLDELEKDINSNEQLDLFDWAGCGCFSMFETQDQQ